MKYFVQHENGVYYIRNENNEIEGEYTEYLEAISERAKMELEYQQGQELIDINSYIPRIHGLNVAAGWWTDLNTGASLVSTRNRPEMMLLAISEIVEAWEGEELMDDHLPQYPMPIVEFADAFIRLCDQCGAEGFEVTQQDIERFANETEIEIDYFGICIYIARALEGYRKRTKTEQFMKYRDNMIQALLMSVSLGKLYLMEEGIEEYDFYDVVDAKIEYNQNRADHKIDNRKLEGGKSI